MNSTTFKPEEGGQLTSRVQPETVSISAERIRSGLSAGLQRPPAAAAAAAATGDTAATAATSISESNPNYGRPATAFCRNEIAAVITVAAAVAVASAYIITSRAADCYSELIHR